MIRVLIADDQPSVRRALRTFLHTQDDIRVTAEAGSGPEAVTKAREQRPDVVLMDVRMPGGDGISATASLTGNGVADPIPVVVITTFDLDEYLFGALENGAVGFLLKDAQPAHIIDAVRAAATGDGLVSPAVTRRVIGEFARRRTPAPPGSSIPDLTPRERDVLDSLTRGLSNAEIAARLFIEIGTVKTHVSSIIRRLGVRDRVQAIVWAYQTPGWQTDREGEQS
ncbi:response regulator transcription factor [Okibacterium endophyticum]